jgi:2'-5' RNA ligase
MAGFLVEFRSHGYAKDYAKELIYSVAKKFRVKGVTRKKVVPHIALYGPGETKDIRRVVSVVERVGRKYTLVPFRIKGFGFFDKAPKVIYLDISPSQELEELRWELSQELRKVSSYQPWDSHRNHAFHGTIAFKDIDNKFNQIWSYIKSREEPNIKQYLLRITVIGARSRIVCEYDLVLKKLLNRRQALSKYWWRKTVKKLRELEGLPPERQPFLMDWLRKVFGWLK